MAMRLEPLGLLAHRAEPSRVQPAVLVCQDDVGCQDGVLCFDEVVGVAFDPMPSWRSRMSIWNGSCAWRWNHAAA